MQIHNAMITPGPGRNPIIFMEPRDAIMESEIEGMVLQSSSEIPLLILNSILKDCKIEEIIDGRPKDESVLVAILGNNKFKNCIISKAYFDGCYFHPETPEVANEIPSKIIGGKS